MRWWSLEVAGPSMAPTLLHGDWVVAWRTRRARVGDVVVARRPDRPDLLVVKRVNNIDETGIWLKGDNPLASDDSAVFGPVTHIEARVVARYWPRLTLRGFRR